MVSFKPRTLLKYRRGATASHPKQEHLGGISARRISKLDVIKNKRVSQFFSTLRSSTLSQKFATSKEPPAGPSRRNSGRRNILRISKLNFHSINKPPIIIAGPSISSMCPSKDPNVQRIPVGLHDDLSLRRTCKSSSCLTRQVIMACEASPLDRISNSRQLEEITASSTGSLGSWVEVSEVGSRPAILVRVGTFSGLPSDSVLEGLQALLPRRSGFDPSDPQRFSLASAFREDFDNAQDVTQDLSTSSFNDQSFVRMAETELGW